MLIEVLYFAGCPHYRPTLDLLEAVIAESGVAAEVREVEVCNDADAARLRFLGSPTIRVDGADIEPDTEVRTDYALSCRMYGVSGVPGRDLLEAALRTASAR